MKVEWAGFLPVDTSWDSIRGARPTSLIESLDLRGVQPHDIAAYAAWRTLPEPEDHPDLGAVAFLVRPDGSRAQLGSGATGGWNSGMNSSPVQALNFPVAGTYSLEVRPARTATTDQLPSTAPVGERILATVTIDVSI